MRLCLDWKKKKSYSLSLKELNGFKVQEKIAFPFLVSENS